MTKLPNAVSTFFERKKNIILVTFKQLETKKDRRLILFKKIVLTVLLLNIEPLTAEVLGLTGIVERNILPYVKKLLLHS